MWELLSSPVLHSTQPTFPTKCWLFSFIYNLVSRTWTQTSIFPLLCRVLSHGVHAGEILLLPHQVSDGCCSASVCERKL